MEMTFTVPSDHTTEVTLFTDVSVLFSSTSQKSFNQDSKNKNRYEVLFCEKLIKIKFIIKTRANALI